MIKTPFTSLIILTALFLPLLVLGQEPAGGLVAKAGCTGVNCGFSNFITLINEIMNYIILLSLPATAIVAAFAGFQMITSGDNAGKRDEAKKMLWKVVIGFVFILSAWLIVKAITSPLLQSNYVTF